MMRAGTIVALVGWLGCGGSSPSPRPVTPKPAVVTAPARPAAPAPALVAVAEPAPVPEPTPPQAPLVFPVAWMKTAASTRNFAEAVAIRTDGSIVVAGSGDVPAWVKKSARPAKSRATVFVASLDASGAALWVQGFEAGDGTVRAAQALPDGSVVVCGDFDGTLRLDRAALATARGNRDLFIAALGLDGKLRWVFAAGGKDYDSCHDVALLPDGRIVFAGTVTGDVQFGELGPRALGGRDAFVGVLDAAGHPQWVSRGGSAESDEVRAVAVAGDKIYITGWIGAAATFGGHAVAFSGRVAGVPPRTSNPSSVFVARYGINGDTAWATAFGAVESFDRGWSAAGLSDGGVAIVGDYREHAFVARYGADGRRRWLREAGTPSAARDVLALDGDRLLVAAYWGWPQGGPVLELAGTSEKRTLQAQGSDTVIAQYAADGELLAAGRLAGATPHHNDERNGSELEICAMARSPAGRIALAGRLWGSAFVDPGDLFRPTKARVAAVHDQDTVVIMLDPPE